MDFYSPGMIAYFGEKYFSDFIRYEMKTDHSHSQLEKYISLMSTLCRFTGEFNVLGNISMQILSQ